MSAFDDWRPGSTVGEYRLLRRLGAGGMGAVDLAQHVATGAERAIKSIVAPLDPDLLQRFQREIEALARVDGHPHVARIHSSGVAHGRPYLVMDVLPGGDLERRLRAGPLRATEVVELGLALASGLAHIHARGVLHRDLKPANVLFDEQERPVLVDFGLARTSDARSLTATGEVVGTPAFMAPEQVLGDKAAIGPRTDVYGLGALLYAALTGRPPAVGRSAIEVLTSVLEQAPPAPNTLVGGVPLRLEQVLLRALAKRPEQRFASIDEMSAALRTALAAPRGPGTGLATVVAALALVAITLVAAFATGTEPVSVAPVVVVNDLAPIVSAEPAPPPRVEPAPAWIDARPPTIEAVDEPPASLPVEHLPVESREISTMLGALGVAEALSLRATRQGYADDHELHVVAAQTFKQVAEAGGDDAPRAWANLGRAFEHGFGVQRSLKEAVRCFERSAARGDLMGMLSLSIRLRERAPEEGRDLVRARDLLRRVLESGSGTPQALPARFGLVQIALLDDQVVTIQEAVDQLGRAAPDELGAEQHLIGATLLERLGRIADAARECDLALDDPGYCGDAGLQKLGLLLRAGLTEEAAAARADLERRAAVQAGCATNYGRLLVGEGRVAEARRLYRWVAEKPEPNLTWHCRTARVELYRLCLRARAEDPAAFEEARELLLREPDGERLVATER